MDVHQAIRTRRSVRKYDPRPIPDNVMGRLHDALRLAPSACNFQPWRFVLVRDAAQRRAIAQAACGQTWMADAPLIVVGCGRPAAAYKKMGGAGNSADVDVAIALDHLTLAAAAEGLGTCWIGAFEQARVKDLLGIPADATVVAMTPVGYPAEPDAIHPIDPARRKGPDEVFSTDRY